MQMLKALASGLFIPSLLISISAADDGFPGCNCEEEVGFWSAETIQECQRVSDFLIAMAYFSIPIELLYFVSCSNVPFKWVLFQFIAFIVLCGMTHFLNFWTYGPHPFQLMLAVTVFKFLTALVSFATAITLVTLIPLLLKVKVREFILEKKTRDLGREVGIIKKQKEAGWHVRMLTQEIRKSLDRHTILYTTLVELSKTLDLQNCAVWMPNDPRTEMNLTHDLKGRNLSNMYDFSIPICDPDIQEIKGCDGVKILDPGSALAAASSGGIGEAGAVAAIRMPMLRVSDFKGGTPELIKACYAMLVLVLPGGQGRNWCNQELEIVEVVADQVAVALSHAAVLEESQLMREKLENQNRALLLAKQDAMMASCARNSFQTVMSYGLRRPMHSILGLLSMLQDENLSDQQQATLIGAMVKTSNVLSALINDVMDTSMKDDGRFPLDMKSFQLHCMIKEAACLAKCLCVYRGYGFIIEVDKSLPDHVLGDERRLFQVILHMVGNLLNHSSGGGGCMTIRVFPESPSRERNVQRWANWSTSSSDDCVPVKFEIGMNKSDSLKQCFRTQDGHEGLSREKVDKGLSFSVCRKLVQMMQGNIWMVPNPEGFDQSMALVLHLQLRPSIAIGIYSEPGECSSEHPHSNSLFQGLQVLLADVDYVNRAVTKKLLEKLGCNVSAVSSGFECLSALGPASASASSSSIQIVLLDLHLPDLDGFELTLRIRKFRSSSWPLIIAFTASADNGTRARCLQTGMNGFIRKPALLQGIADELRRVLLLQVNNVV